MTEGSGDEIVEKQAVTGGTVKEAVTGAALITALAQVVLGEATKTVLEPMGGWGAAIGLGALIAGWVILQVSRRARAEQRAPEIAAIVEAREVRLNPWYLVAVGAGVLLAIDLAVSFFLGAVYGWLLGALIGSGVDPAGINTAVVSGAVIVTFVAVLAGSAWTGRYISHRAATHELWLVVASVFLYRAVGTLVSLAVVPSIDLVPWLAYTAAMLVAGWLGHRLAVRTQDHFTLSYLFAELSTNDQAHLLDLVGSVVAPTASPPPTDRSGDRTTSKGTT